MSDHLLRGLAAKLGIPSRWTDQYGQQQQVGLDTLRAILGALDVPAWSEEQVRNAISAYETGIFSLGSSQFLTARVGLDFALPLEMPPGTVVEVEHENGATRAVSSIEGFPGALTLPPFESPGYHTIRTGGQEFTVAVAPDRCVSVHDLTEGRDAWGIGTQIYGLRRRGDGGIGDFGSLAALARDAAAFRCDALAVSPVHALHGAFPEHFSPYSPSSRLAYNPLHADPAVIFPSDMLAAAIDELGIGEEMARLEALDLIDWSHATRIKLRLFRRLYERLVEAPPELQDAKAEFFRYRETCPDPIRSHAIFEAIHADQLRTNQSLGHWRDWPEALRSPDASGVADFAQRSDHEIGFHVFLQWLTSRSYSECQRVCRENGMRIGLIADLAIGMDPGGSHAWSRQSDILRGVSIGAPPDYYNADGQSWGLTSFSPRGLNATAFRPFIDTLRAVLRHAGGVRIDHIMGLRRLWLVPDGAKATEGGYLELPVETLFRLLALESWRHGAMVIGEDLGVVPDGFRDVLSSQAMAGMRVLRFEREGDLYRPPDQYDAAAVAMTTTHDMAPMAGWWSGTDLDEMDARLGPSEERRQIRAWDRGLLWAAFESAGLVQGERPLPEQTEPVVDASVAFIASTPCCMKLLALEDALGVEEQPNVPGTTTEVPNWRHRLKGEAGQLLEGDAIARRLRRLGGTAEDCFEVEKERQFQT